MLLIGVAIGVDQTNELLVGRESVVLAKLGDLEPLLQQVPLAFRDQLVDGDNDFLQFAKPRGWQVAAELAFADPGQLQTDLFEGAQQAASHPGDHQAEHQQAGEQRKSGTTDGVPQMLVGVTLVSLEREGTENAPAVGQLLLNLDRRHVDN